MKRLFGIAAAVCAALAVSAAPRAQTYPARPVQMLIHFNAGAVVDILARGFAEELSGQLGQPFLVVNREGASGIISNTAVAQARPDGYTLALTPQGSLVVQPHLKKDLGYSLESFVPICQLFENHFVIAVSHDSPFKTLDDIVDYARANPNKISFGVWGLASVPHLQFHSFLFAAKLDMTQVPYKNIGTVIQDTASRQVDIGITAFGSFNPQQIRVIATLAGRRNELYPDVPSMAELGYPISHPAFSGLMAPKGTPAEIIGTLEAACAKAAQSTRWHEVLKRTGTPAAYLPAPEYAKRLREDFAAKGELVRALDIKD
jgi:tripartite-type tricarboxylate transporter receptor subunit TctC